MGDPLNGIIKILEDGIKINKNKAKFFVCTKNKRTPEMYKEKLEGVNYFRYLGSKIIWDERIRKEIKSGIAKAKIGFNSNQKLLCPSSINLEIRNMMLKIGSFAMFGFKT